jgi:hypothetical protein
MNAVTPSELERAEVESVLQSGLFDRATRLGKFFRYICERHFEGHADQIKEYSIALEALGRPAEFDPKKDSIVRVEAHRLRKRLEEYYRGPGAAHAVHIAIPNGQYRPVFVATEAENRAAENPAAIASIPAPTRKLSWAWLAPALLACAAAVAFLAPAAHEESRIPPAVANEIWTGPATEPVPAEFRMLAGYHGAPAMDRQGHLWGPDAYYRGGLSSPIPGERLIEAQPDPHFLKAHRSGTFRYDIPLRQGTYELHLYFAETEFGNGNPGGGGDSTRVFHVSINGARRLENLDPLAQSGAPNRLLERVFKDISPAADGKLHLQFDPQNAPAFLNALEILPSAPGRIHPVRIVAQANPVTDSDGHFWAADEYFCGGTLVSRHNLVLNPPEKALYQGERFGNFSYRIPLAPGKYRLTLHFAETWFGTPESNQAALDNRIFDVFANGMTLLRDYQIVKEAGGPNRSVEKVFNNLEPNAQGMLLVEFVPVKNYAEVNAIEVVEIG